MAKSKTATASEETKGVSISHRPPGDFASDWDEVLLERHKDYLKTNARTDNGQQVVTGVNNVVDLWQTCLSGYISDTSTAKIVMI